MFDTTSTKRPQERARPVSTKYLIAIVAIIGAAVAAIIVRVLLKSYVSEPVRQGAGMYVMWICLYPLMKAWARKPRSLSRKRRLTFIGWAIIGLLPAVFVTVAYIYFP